VASFYQGTIVLVVATCVQLSRVWPKWAARLTSFNPMSESEEIAYIQGHRAAWQQMLNEAIRQLGYDSPDANAARWALEREAAIQSLRSLCRAKGDNEWEENLHLQDIIEKHLGDHLRG